MRWRRGGGGDGGGDGGGGGRETETRDKRIHDARNNPASISSKPYKNKQKEEEVGGGGEERGRRLHLFGKSPVRRFQKKNK